MNKVRLGLIGMGMIGKLHAETMSKMKDLEFVAASDVDAKHQKTAEELGTKFYQSYEEMIGKEKLKKLRLYGYTTKNKKIVLKRNETNFEIDGEKFKLKVSGKYNVSNALGVIVLGKIFGIPIGEIKKSLADFGGIGRRLELIGEKNGVKVYDDYAHHPSAIKVTLAALKQKYPKKKIWVIVEPHTYSRTKALLALYKNVFKDASQVIIAPIFKSRDTTDFGVSGESIVKISNHKNIKYIDSFEKITALVCRSARKEDVIIVMGAGESYKLARNILEGL